MPTTTVHCQIYMNGRVIMPNHVSYRKSKYNELHDYKLILSCNVTLFNPVKFIIFINCRIKEVHIGLIKSIIREHIVNKFLEKYSKTHIFRSTFIFISQHNLLSARYPWSNNSPTFSSRPNNMICPTLPNKPLFRRWAALWWWSLSSEPFLQVFGNRK